ncbi:cytochrome-c peroxidase [Dyadobacter chenhuakuii]|uniref:Cytochrome-c peroxidase n=1 Tax=Dyadobacter chenhuakuii TaxID=2909339 RepID=A0ABY4XRF1_9BACT|nr:cytochrome c peroxidase [Dyadobacter chenhuakuii]MCF2493149.1 cytochrome-c peroxidase [Dyadobacter chenhuakuii]USJ32567.1 cytochrome-c peroxidase [Dyadobacter chenhuakuii]
MHSLLFLIGLAFIGISCGGERGPLKNKKEKTVETIDALGALPKYVTDPPGNKSTPEKIRLGKLLFFDPILSGNKDVSCATCHQPEFNYAEFLETSIGVNGHGTGSKRKFSEKNDIPFVKRNSQSIVNTAFNGIKNGESYDAETAPMFWDLRAKGLEEQALIPVRTLEEMRGHSYPEDKVIDQIVARIQKVPAYKSLFREAFREDANPVNVVNLTKAIASYERTLIANNSRFDQYMRGDSSALTTGEKEGLNLFLKTGCAKCHSGPMLSDYKLHTLGVPDSQNRKETDAGANNDYAFRTPSLRNLRYTGPYMHSGKFATLEQVLQFYEDIAGGKIPNPNVKPSQIDTLAADMDVNFRDISRIVEFLNALNDDNFDKSVPERVPSGLPVSGL